MHSPTASTHTNLHTQAQEQGRKPSTADVDEKFLKDVSLLKSLEATISQWTRAIRQVTELDRDPASGTARQEITCGVLATGSLTHCSQLGSLSVCSLSVYLFPC